MLYSNETRYVWFRRLDGCGEEMLDLLECLRFVLDWHTDRDDGEYTRIYFMIPTQPRRWLKLVGDICWDGENSFNYCESLEEVAPEEVAHDLLWPREFKGGLPKELEDYREFGDPVRYREWAGNWVATEEDDPSDTNGSVSGDWFQCSQAELLEALDYHRSSDHHLERLKQLGQLKLRRAQNPRRKRTLEVLFTNPKEHAEIVEKIQQRRKRR